MIYMEFVALINRCSVLMLDNIVKTNEAIVSYHTL